MTNICVYCGSKAGAQPEYVETARLLGQTLAEHGLGLVYGGASVGIMGEVATAALNAGGKVTGIIPRNLLEKEIAHPNLTELIVVESMHERKAKMEEISDGFIALPGGLGTLEEIFEMLTWVQLGLHKKPCGFLNVKGYYDHLVQFLDHTVQEGFVWSDQREGIFESSSVEQMLQKMKFV